MARQQKRERRNRGSGPRSGGSLRRRGPALTLRLTVAVLIIDFVALCDIAVCVVAFGTDDNTLGAAAWLLTRSGRRGFPARHEHRGGLVIYGPVVRHAAGVC